MAGCGIRGRSNPIHGKCCLPEGIGFFVSKSTEEIREAQREGGRLGSRRRWGERRRVRLDALRPEARRLILALLEAAEADAREKSALETQPGGDPEGAL